MYRGVPQATEHVPVTIHIPTRREQRIQALYSQRLIKNKRRLSTVFFNIASPDAPDENIKFGKFAVNHTGSCRAEYRTDPIYSTVCRLSGKCVSPT